MCRASETWFVVKEIRMAILMVYVACASKQEALRIGKACVDGRLAACASVVPNVESYFLWKGKGTKSKEALLLLKTNKDAYSRLEMLVRKLHSYSIPCIVAYPSAAVSRPFERWVGESVE